MLVTGSTETNIYERKGKSIFNFISRFPSCSCRSEREVFHTAMGTAPSGVERRKKDEHRDVLTQSCDSRLQKSLQQFKQLSLQQFKK